MKYEITSPFGLLVPRSNSRQGSNPKGEACTDIFFILTRCRCVRFANILDTSDFFNQSSVLDFYRSKVGTVFDGKSEFNLTIGEWLRKQATF